MCNDYSVFSRNVDWLHFKYVDRTGDGHVIKSNVMFEKISNSCISVFEYMDLGFLVIGFENGFVASGISHVCLFIKYVIFRSSVAN